MDPLEQRNLISTKEAAALSGYNADYLTRMCRSGKIHGTQIGRIWLVSRTSLDRFITSQQQRKDELRKALIESREQEYKKAQIDAIGNPSPKIRAPFDHKTFRQRSFALLITLFVLTAGVSSARLTGIASAGTIALNDVIQMHELLTDSSQASRTLAYNETVLAFSSSIAHAQTSAAASAADATNGAGDAIAFIAAHPFTAAADAYFAYAYGIHDALNAYDDAIYAWVNVAPEIPAATATDVIALGRAVNDAALSVPGSIAQGYGASQNIAGTVGYDSVAAAAQNLEPLTMNAAASVRGTPPAVAAMLTGTYSLGKRLVTYIYEQFQNWFSNLGDIAVNKSLSVSGVLTADSLSASASSAAGITGPSFAPATATPSSLAEPLTLGDTLWFANASDTDVIAANFTATGTTKLASLSVDPLNGFLEATAGAISTSLIKLTSDVSGVLPDGNGAIGTSSFATNGVISGDGTNGFLTVSQGSPNAVLILANDAAPPSSNAVTIGVSSSSLQYPLTVTASAGIQGSSTLTDGFL